MNRLVCHTVIFVLLLTSFAGAAEHHVVSHGSCAISGMTDEQAYALALRRARSAAVEQAAGAEVTSASLVTDGRLAGDFIKSFSRGIIVDESVTWEPVGQYQPNPAKPPLIEYRVKLDATVEIPDKARPNLGLNAELNRHIFRAHKDKLVFTIRTAAPARVAIFNITADDQVVMLYPEANGKPLAVCNGKKLTLPDSKKGGDLLLATLPGHKHDTEALLVAALPDDADATWSASFVEGQPVPLTTFFKRYAALAPQCEDVILSYEVFTE